MSIGSSIDPGKYTGIRQFHDHFLLGNEVKIETQTRWKDGVPTTYILLNKHLKHEVKTQLDSEGKPKDYVMTVLSPSRRVVRDRSKYNPRTTYGKVSLDYLAKNGMLPTKKQRLEFAKAA
jgi:hypothetical protein